MKFDAPSMRKIDSVYGSGYGYDDQMNIFEQSNINEERCSNLFIPVM